MTFTFVFCIFVANKVKIWSPENAIKNTRKRKQQPLVDPSNFIDGKYILQYILGSHNTNFTIDLVLWSDFAKKVSKIPIFIEG